MYRVINSIKRCSENNYVKSDTSLCKTFYYSLQTCHEILYPIYKFACANFTTTWALICISFFTDSFHCTNHLLLHGVANHYWSRLWFHFWLRGFLEALTTCAEGEGGIIIFGIWKIIFFSWYIWMYLYMNNDDTIFLNKVILN